MFIFLIVLLLLLMIIYVFFRVHSLSFIKKINNKFINIFITLIPFVILFVFGYIDLINTFSVFIHLFLILIIFDFIFFILRKISKKNLNYSISFIMAFCFTFVYMGYGYYLAHHVVETKYIIDATKNIGVDNFRIVQVTDSHIGATMNGDEFIAYMEKINKTNPDIVVVTGDFVDDDTLEEDMIKACRGLGNLKTKYGVYFVYGNHDKGYFTYRTYDDTFLRKELKKNNVIILEDESINILDNIILVGRQDTQVSTRETAWNLTKDLDKSKYIITLDHEPNDYENEANADMDLVISGHTHGGQFFPLGPIGVKFGSNDSYYGLQKRKNTTFIVSSGIGDWAIKFKTGTISEYVIIDITNKK